MYATMFLMFFLLFIPKTMKTTGINYMIDGRKQGIFLFLFAKALWWFLLIQIAFIWFDGVVLTVIEGIAVVGILVKLYQERRYFSMAFQKRGILS